MACHGIAWHTHTAGHGGECGVRASKVSGPRESRAGAWDHDVVCSACAVRCGAAVAQWVWSGGTRGE